MGEKLLAPLRGPVSATRSCPGSSPVHVSLAAPGRCATPLSTLATPVPTPSAPFPSQQPCLPPSGSAPNLPRSAAVRARGL